MGTVAQGMCEHMTVPICGVGQSIDFSSAAFQVVVFFVTDQQYACFRQHLLRERSCHQNCTLSSVYVNIEVENVSYLAS
jgi:hypothetical protein